MKNKFILVGVDGRPSMKGVYSLIKKEATLLIRRIPNGLEPFYRKYTNSNSEEFTKENLLQDFSDSVLIRWGNRIDVETNEHTVVYNKSEAIAKATDKRLSRSVFYNSNIRAPKIVNPLNVTQADYPVIARPRTHAKGKNFVILKDFGTFKHHYDNNVNNWYYSAFVDKTQEFRVHCAHGKVLGIMSKPAPTKEGVIAWNRAINGEEFTALKWSEFNYDVCLQALKAVEALGLDYGK